jgi:hypothetical protein
MSKRRRKEQCLHVNALLPFYINHVQSAKTNCASILQYSHLNQLTDLDKTLLQHSTMRTSYLLLMHVQTIRLINGNIVNIRAPQAQAVTTAAILARNLGCQLVGKALGICCSLTPDFTDLSATLQAPCLCYSSSSWDPTLFDNAVESCASYASTAIPSAYAPIASLQGFCSSVGNINYPASISATTTTTGTITSSATLSNSACELVNSAIDACTQLTPGFSTMNATDQALCLCYVSTSTWTPNLFDSAVSSCAQFAQTAASSIYLQYSTLEGFCSAVGNILSPSSVVASTTAAPLTTYQAPRPSKTSGYATTGAGYGSSGTATNIGGDFTITIPSTNTGVSAGKSEGGIVKASETEVMFVSFACAALLLFLC